MLRRPAARAKAMLQGPASTAGPAAIPDSGDVNRLSAAARGAALAAIADESWGELVALGDDIRRKHYHWTHVRTHDAAT